MMKKHLLGALLPFFCSWASAQPFFPGSPTLEQPYGVCTHITRPKWDYEIRDKELRKVQEAGMQWVRSDLDFGNFFSSHTTFDPSIFANVLQSTSLHKLNLLGILTWLGALPWDDSKYAQLIEQLAHTFDKRITHWEAMNEVNLIKNVDSLCPKYISTLKTTYETLKRVNPNNKILSSGLGELQEPFLSDFSRLGGWRYCDIFNFHSYFSPEGLIPCFQRLKEVMTRDGWQRPVWITECGMHTANEQQDAAGFYTNLLPAALHRIGMDESHLTIGFLRDAESGYNVLSDSEVEHLLVPYCKQVKACSLSQLAHLSPRKVPVLLAARDEYFPATYFPALCEYVRKGGTIVLSGGMPFYYDACSAEEAFMNRKTIGTKFYDQLHMATPNTWADPISGETIGDVPPCCERNEEIPFSYGWTPTSNSPARYLSDACLHPGDSLIPLISAGTAHLRYPIAGIYRLQSNLKGNIIFQTRMYAKAFGNKEEEQARRVPRLFLIAFAYGVDKVFWYNLRSREEDTNYSEDCFGLLHSDLSDKPAMQAYRTLTQMCPPGSQRPQIEMQHHVYHVAWVKPDGTKMHALWSAIGKQRIGIRKHGACTITNHMGLPLKSTGRHMMLNENVCYVNGNIEIEY